jgi:cytochrome c peroxidase
MKSRTTLVGLITAVLIVAVGIGYLAWPKSIWTSDQIVTLRGLWIGSMKPLSPDPSNKYADDPRAAELGQKLFFDTGFSANGAVACATCHDPQKGFQDGLPLSNGVGTTNRRAMSIVGTAYSPWLFWDGRKDSQWAQALGPMESAVEHGGNRTIYAHRIAQRYRDEYEAVFGPLPNLASLPLSAGPVDDRWRERHGQAWRPLTRTLSHVSTRIWVRLSQRMSVK